LYQENSDFEPRPGYQHADQGLFMVAFSRFTAVMGHDLAITQTSSTSLIFAVPDVSISVNARVM
jgi:Ca2+/Na+ antiporter